MTVTEQPRTSLEVRDLTVTLRSGTRGALTPVRRVTFDVGVGEVVGIVGESGAGKSMLGHALLGLLPNGGSMTGSIKLNGTELVGLGTRALRQIRGHEVSIIMQDPATTLNPALTVGVQIAEALRRGNLKRRDEIKQASIGLLAGMDVPFPEQRLRQYPHELSGGIAQRVVCAIAFAHRPRLIVADEPTTALDVTVQARLLALLKDLKVRHNCSMVFITHDLRLVSQMADRTMVMYAGRIVEEGLTSELFASPAHPYSRGLLDSSNVPLDGRPAGMIPGRAPELDAIGAGCAFAERCDRAREACRIDDPAASDLGRDRRVRCHYPITIPDIADPPLREPVG